MVESTDRRKFLGVAGVVGVAATGGCLGLVSGNQEEGEGSPPDDSEVDGFELGAIKEELQHTRFGLITTVYNSTSEQAKVTVQFTVLDESDVVTEVTDSVVVGAHSEAPISYYWDTTEEGIDPNTGDYEVKIVSGN